MTKRTFSFMLVLAMLVSVLPVNVVTAEKAQTVHTHTDSHVCGEKCPGGTIAWEAVDALPDKSGHYYLKQDITLRAAHTIPAGTDITICLNGWNITSSGSGRLLNVKGKLTISDCTAFTDSEGNYISGALTGADCSDVGGAVNIFPGKPGATLVLESGKISGNSSASTGGAIFMQKGTSAGNGGAFYMYGGQIADNEASVSGGGIFADGADDSYGHPQVHIYGGTLRGNKALSVKSGEGCGGAICLWGKNQATLQNAVIEGNTSSHGAIYAQTTGTICMTDVTVTDNQANSGKTETGVYIDGGTTRLTVSGKTVISGNAGGKDLTFNNKSNPGLKVNGLTGGSLINAVTHRSATSFIGVAEVGKQESWSAHWVTINNASVSMVNGAFLFGHYHGTTKYEPWTGGASHNTLPTGNKSYYLANHITRNTNGGTIGIEAGTTQHLCLNGFTITHRNPAGRLYNIQGTFFLEDCTAYTDAEGKYVSGGITYDGADMTRTYGNCFSVRRGGTMTMQGGQIYGFHSQLAASQDSVPVYVQGAQTSAKAVFHMLGGEIHSNTTNASGAAIRLTKASSNPATENFSEVNISGGKIWGNTSTSNGGAIAMTGDCLNISGGVIENNTANMGAVYAAAEVKLSISGNPVIRNNQGGNLYLADDVMMDLSGLTGGQIGIGAAKAGRKVGTISWDASSCFTCDDSALRISFRTDCLYLGAAHGHGIDGGTGDLGWSKWTSNDTLPAVSGNYYLANDIQLKEVVSLANAQNINICLNGKTVTAASGVRVLAVSNGSTVTITDCCDVCGTITGGYHSYGGAINVLRGGTLNFYNGKITGCTGREEGGAVYVQSAKDGIPGAVFNMYGGEVSGNTAKRGGAITLAGQDAQVNIYGGTVKNNTATTGGGIYTYPGAKLTVAHGAVTENTATKEAGGVYVSQGIALLRVMETPVIKDNLVGQQPSNLYLAGSATIVDAGLRKGAELFITAEMSDRIITGAVVNEEAGACFFSDSAYREVVQQNDDIYYNTTGEHTHCDCFHKTQGCQHLIVKWQAWESTTSLPTISGNYYLLDDVVLADRWTVPSGQDVKLCLNGKTVTAPEDDRLLQVTQTAKVSMTDCLGTGTLTGGKCTFGGAIHVSRRGTFSLYGGTITGNEANGGDDKALGGGVYIQAGKTGEAGGIFHMYGGTITKNTGYAGGAIHAAVGEVADAEPAQVNIYGGTITGNTAGNNGAAIYAGKYSVVTMTGGTISGNSGSGYGGNIYLSGATGKFSGGKITGNTSEKDGGGLYAVGASTVEISGDMEISNNQVPAGAGGGFGGSGKSQITMTGGTVSGNYALQGGGATIQSGAKLTLTGGTVTGNNSGKAAGGVYVNKGYMEMTGGYVGNNATKTSGGGVYVNKSSMDFLGGTIAGNTSVRSGAGLFANDSTTRFAGTVFTGNEATANGGAVYINKGKAIFDGGTCSDNSSLRYGGGIYMNAAEVTMNKATITGNFAKVGSGGIHAFGGKLILEKDVLVAENKTDSAGGGICVTKFCELFINGAVFEKNEANNGGGVLIRNWARATLNDAIIRENVSTEGSGLYIFSNVVVAMNGGEVSGNIAKTKRNKAGKTVGGDAAGVYLHTATTTQSGGSTLYLKGVDIHNNVAQAIGGGVFVDKQMILHMEGCTVQNNQAEGQGAGIYQASGTKLTVKDTKILANTGKAMGSALYAGSDLELDGCTITGNKTTDGTAVYVAPARYDGHSYTNGVIKLGGDMQICENEGTMEGDLYFDEGVAAAGTAGGFGKNTKIKIQLHSGLLTNSVLAAYDYQGGDRVYTITYGDRSLREPEYVPPAEEKITGKTGTQEQMLYAAVGLFVALVAAVAVLLLVKKKKAGKKTGEETKG